MTAIIAYQYVPRGRLLRYATKSSLPLCLVLQQWLVLPQYMFASLTASVQSQFPRGPRWPWSAYWRLTLPQSRTPNSLAIVLKPNLTTSTVGYIVAVYRDGGIILNISPSFLLVLLLPSESSSLHDVPWLGAICM